MVSTYQTVRYHNPEDPVHSRLLVITVLYILLSSSHIMSSKNNCVSAFVINWNFDWKSGSEREPKFSTGMEAVCFYLKRHLTLFFVTGLKWLDVRLALRLRMSGAIHLLPPACLRGVDRYTFTFTCAPCDAHGIYRFLSRSTLTRWSFVMGTRSVYCEVVSCLGALSRCLPYIELYLLFHRSFCLKVKSLSLSLVIQH
jgi:hypothetical protein